MTANQPPWPREWLMTDERIGDRLWQAIERVPPGGGVVFRHYSLEPAQRLKLGKSVAAAAEARQLVLSVAQDVELAGEMGAQLIHNPMGPAPQPFSLAVHDEAQAHQARLAGAALVFVSPVFRTRSHPGSSALGAEEAARLVKIASCPAIALGGMDAARFRELEAAHPGAFHGYAGIDCWLRPSRE